MAINIWISRRALIYENKSRSFFFCFILWPARKREIKQGVFLFSVMNAKKKHTSSSSYSSYFVVCIPQDPSIVRLQCVKQLKGLTWFPYPALKKWKDDQTFFFFWFFVFSFSFIGVLHLKTLFFQFLQLLPCSFFKTVSSPFSSPSSW